MYVYVYVCVCLKHSNEDEKKQENVKNEPEKKESTLQCYLHVEQKKTDYISEKFPEVAVFLFPITLLMPVFFQSFRAIYSFENT